VGLLFIFLVGISAIILIARFASKTRPKEERLPEAGGGRYQNGGERYPKKPLYDRSILEEGLLSLLIKKGVITEEELLSEMELIKKMKEEH
jgi:hypothetical protein